MWGCSGLWSVARDVVLLWAVECGERCGVALGCGVWREMWCCSGLCGGVSVEDCKWTGRCGGVGVDRAMWRCAVDGTLLALDVTFSCPPLPQGPTVINLALLHTETAS